MGNDQNRGKTNDEPVDDAMSALRRLAALDKTEPDISHPASSSQAGELVDTMPDWLELLLAKYGERASNLIGIETDVLASLPPGGLADSQPTGREESEMASLLEQMAAKAEVEPSEQLPARPEDEVTEDQEPDWLDQVTKQYERPPTAPAFEEEAPDWLSEIGDLEPEAQTPAEGPEGAEYLADAEEVPDWLQELPTAPQPAKPSPPEVAPSEDEIPDWMEELSAAVPSVEAPEAAQETRPPHEDEIPDWMKDLVFDAPQVEDQPPADQMATSPPVTPEAEEAETEIPDWLAQLAEVPERSAEAELPEPIVPESEVKAPAEPEEETPDWLSRLQTLEEAPAGEPLEEIEAEVAAPKAEEEIPDWLHELETPEAAPPAEPPAAKPLAAVVAEAPAEPEEEIPDWLHELETPEAAPPAEPPAAEPLAAVVAEAPAEPEEEIPDWLSRLQTLEEEPPSAPQKAEPPPEVVPEALPEAEEETPEWLSRLQALEEAPPAEPPAEREAEVAAHEPEEEIPDWLHDLEAPEAAAPAEPPAAEPPAAVVAEAPAEPEEEIPDWLHELETSEEAPPAEEPPPERPAEAPAEPEAEVPDWLASLRAEEPSPLEMAIEQDISSMEPPEAERAEEPDWLSELRMTSGSDALVTDEEIVEAEEKTLPDWLAELKSSQAAAEVPPVSLEALEEPAESLEVEAEVLPIEFLPMEDEAESVEAAPVDSEGEGALDWLAEIEAAADIDYAESEISAPEETLEITPEAHPAAEEDIAPTEVLSWLPELELEQEEPPASGQVETPELEDVLAGIPGLLPIATEEAEGDEEAELRPPVEVPAVPDVEGARLFKEITSKPLHQVETKGKAELEPESRRSRVVETLAWALIFVILIVAIALALVAVLGKVGDLVSGPAFRDFFGSPLVIDPAPVNTFRAEVTKLPPNAVVVISFDYSPSTEAEMGPLAQIIVDDLLENQARVIAVSLRPEGAAMAQRLFNQFESEYPYGQRTINLGYLPGQTAGVRSLAFLSSAPLFQNGAQTLEDYPAWQDVNGLGNVALIVTVADSPMAVRWWVEQAGPGSLANRPMVAAISAAADPSVRPYYNQIDPKSGQLLGLLSGVKDAAAYENRLRKSGRAVDSLAAQSVAHLGLVVLSLAGTVVGFKTQATKE
jgi:hypothetical protein